MEKWIFMLCVYSDNNMDSDGVDEPGRIFLVQAHADLTVGRRSHKSAESNHEFYKPSYTPARNKKRQQMEAR